MFSSGRFMFSSPSYSGLLFEKSSWSGLVPEPFKSHLDAAADRWARYVRFNKAVAKAIPTLAPSSEWSSWNGIRLQSPQDYTETVLGKTFVVTSSGGRYVVDGVEAPKLPLVGGQTYTFDLSHPSNNGHPMRFSTSQDGIHTGGVQYSTGVTVSGTPGTSGAYVRLQPTNSTPDLYYYCMNHAGMGGAVEMWSSDTIAACYVYNFVTLGSGVKMNAASFGLIINKYYENLYSTADWVNILTHELGHALGIGIFWNPALQAYGAVPPTDNFLSGSAYVGCRNAYRSVAANANYVKIPLESTGSAGTASAHWENDFRPSSATGSGGMSHAGLVNELMVGYYSAGMNSIISDVSIKALVDFGYEEVNPGANEGVPEIDNGMGMLKQQAGVRLHCGCGRVPQSLGSVNI